MARTGQSRAGCEDDGTGARTSDTGNSKVVVVVVVVGKAGTDLPTVHTANNQVTITTHPSFTSLRTSTSTRVLVLVLVRVLVLV